MNATPSWLHRCAVRFQKESRARGRRAINPTCLEQLEHRSLPGSGVISWGILPGWMRDDDGQAAPAELASAQVSPIQAVAPAAASTRKLPPASISTSTAPMATASAPDADP